MPEKVVPEETAASVPPENKSRFSWGCAFLFLVLVVLVLFSIFRFGFFPRGGSSFKNNTTEKKQEDESVELSKPELIDYFVDLTIFYAGVDKPMELVMWKKKIVTVSIEDEPPESGSKVLEEFINKFNDLSSETKLQQVAKGGDIEIYFQVSTSGSAGKAGPSSGIDTIIDHAVVKISHEAALFEQGLEVVLDHEMLHALGFFGHYLGSDCRLMSPTTCGAKFSKNEEKLIKMLYSSKIDDGLDEAGIRSFFESNWNI